MPTAPHLSVARWISNDENVGYLFKIHKLTIVEDYLIIVEWIDISKIMFIVQNSNNWKKLYMDLATKRVKAQ